MSKLIDFELNKAITKIILLQIPNVKSVEYDTNIFWVETVGFSSFPVVDYCNDWAQLMPLVVKFGIDLVKGSAYSKYEGSARIRVRSTFATKTVQRALAECLLKVLESKNG